ncbi:hypothetical protein P9112_004846 [Eukaryota sp. TZLM1-RC]
MVLFSTKTWWQAHLSSSEQSSPDAFCIGNLDNGSSGDSKIASGTLSGIIRIYQPQESQESSAEDLLLEQDLTEPILQLSCGRFIPNSESFALAVLHPRRLSVYLLSFTSGAATSGSYSSLDLLYDHQLPYNAFSMIFGSFGGRAGKDLICIQSMDSHLVFIEHDKFMFACALSPSLFLMPGPLSYDPVTDSFLIGSTSQELFCYSFRSLSATSHVMSNQSQDFSGPVSEWSVNLGDHTVSICALGKCKFIAIVCEHSLVFVSHRGDVLTQVKIDYVPVAACLYPSQKVNESLVSTTLVNHNLIVSTSSRNLLVYSELGDLLWLSKTPSVGRSLLVSCFGDTSGLISALTSDNYLNIWYLGTEQSDEVKVSQLTSEDAVTMEKQRAKLQHQVNKQLAGGRGSKSRRDEVKIDVVSVSDVVVCERDRCVTIDSLDFDCIAQNLSVLIEDGADFRPGLIGSGFAVETTVRISLSTNHDLDDVIISSSTTSPIISLDSQVKISTLKRKNSTPVVIPLTFVCIHNNPNVCVCPGSLVACISVSYSVINTNSKNSKVFEVPLPLNLVAVPINPVKSCEFKATFELSRPIDIMNVFFSNIFSSSESSPIEPSIVQNYKNLYESRGNVTGQVVSFRLCDASEVSIFERSSGKVKLRIQSSHFESMYLFFNYILNYLNTQDDVNINFKDPLPISDLFSLVDIHLNTRHQFIQLQEELSKKAKMFRSIQKRLIVRYKEKNPPPLNGIDLILGSTHADIATLCKDATNVKNCLVRLSIGLSFTVRYFLKLMVIKYSLNPEEESIVESQLCPDLLLSNSFDVRNYEPDDGTTIEDFGWQETVFNSLSSLIKTSQKNSRDRSKIAPGVMMIPDDVNKLHKVFLLFLESLTSSESQKVS